MGNVTYKFKVVSFRVDNKQQIENYTSTNPNDVYTIIDECFPNHIRNKIPLQCYSSIVPKTFMLNHLVEISDMNGTILYIDHVALAEFWSIKAYCHHTIESGSRAMGMSF